MGYNVLSSDLDVHLTQNPYPYLKSPALLGNYALVAQKESPTFPSINCGLVYVQEPTKEADKNKNTSTSTSTSTNTSTNTRSASAGLDVLRRIVGLQRAFLTGNLTSIDRESGEANAHVVWEQHIVNSALERASCGCEAGAHSHSSKFPAQPEPRVDTDCHD